MDVEVRRLLADMEHANAWIVFTAAQANHDLQRFGEWRCDYATQASMFHSDYNEAGRNLMRVREVEMFKLTMWERDMAAETAAWAAFGGERDDWIKQGSGSRVRAFHWLRDVALRWLRRRQGV